VVGDLFVKSRRVLEPLEVETSDERKRLHRQLLRRLLIRMALGAFDFSGRPEMFRARESMKAIAECFGFRRRDGVAAATLMLRLWMRRTAAAVATAVRRRVYTMSRNVLIGREIQGNVPKWVDGCGDIVTLRTRNVRLESAREDAIDDAVAFVRVLRRGRLFIHGRLRRRGRGVGGRGGFGRG